jgi:hypothetical protein
MDAKRLKKFQQRLYSRMPLIAEKRWRKAVQVLVQDGSPTSAHVLEVSVSTADSVPACHSTPFCCR